MLRICNLCLLVTILIGCQKKAENENIFGNWGYTDCRDVVFTDDEYNVVKTVVARETGILVIDSKEIKLMFQVKYYDDSLPNYDTTTTIPYKILKSKLILQINNQEYKVNYVTGDGEIKFQEIDKQPIFIKKSQFLFNRIYYRKIIDPCQNGPREDRSIFYHE